MRLKHYFVYLLFLPFCLSAQDDYFQFSNLSEKEGLSQNTVYCIFQDSKNFVWICTRDGLNRYDGTNFKIFRCSVTDSNSLSSSDVSSITENREGSFWIGTYNGLNQYDPKTGVFQHFFHSDSDKNSLSSSCIKHLFSDRSDNLWIATAKGLDLLDKKTQTFKHVYGAGPVSAILQRSNGELCFSSVKEGFFVYNSQTQKLVNYPASTQDFIYSLHEDGNHQLWAGTWSNGLKKLNPDTKVFESMSLKMANGKTYEHDEIDCILEYKPGYLMLGTRKKLLVYNIKTQVVTQGLTSKADLGENTIHALLKDRSGNVWIGSWKGGVDFYRYYGSFFAIHNPNLHREELVGCVSSLAELNGVVWLATDKGLMSYNPISNAYKAVSLNLPTFSNEVKYLYKDRDNLWISLQAGGLYLFNPTLEKVVKTVKDFSYGTVKDMVRDGVDNYWISTGLNNVFLMLNSKTDLFEKRFEIKGSKQLFTPQNIQDLELESGQTIWVGTRGDGLFRYNYKTKELQQFKSSSDNKSLCNNNVSVIFKDGKRNTWVGTFGGGICLYQPQTNSFKTYNREKGLLNDIVSSITEDAQGMLWITTTEGISRFDPQKETFDNFNRGNDYPLQEPVFHSSARTHDGRIYVGGINTFISFQPARLNMSTLSSNVVVSKFKVWADNVSEASSTTDLIYVDKKIELKYNQAAFTIYFADLNFIFPNNNQYAYMLDGFDKNWNYVKNERSATYTNIPPGNYTFRVKAYNRGGFWNNDGTAFEIHISPPFWRSWWAYLIYFLMVAAILERIYYYIKKQRQLEIDIIVKQLESKNQEENHQLRLRLFTYFSHELRTPLTLIIGPLTDILAKLELQEKLRPKLELIFKNSQRLLWLVNQLMDFRKLDAGFMKLNVSKTDFNPYLQEIVTDFDELAISKKIKLELNSTTNSATVWFDPILIEKVLFNLLSNAFKFTNTDGKVVVAVSEVDQRFITHKTKKQFKGQNALLIQISDQGIGMAQHEVEKIFDPFYQIEGQEVTSVLGTGIGLNLCKEIVELHQGVIWAESELNVGSSFCVLLPFGNEHFAEADLVESPAVDYDRPVVIDLPNRTIEPVSPVKPIHDKGKDVFNVLVVEDNEEVRQYIKSLLIDNYHVIEAEDCAIGCKMAIEFVPDLIISDVMTPNMNGFELCQELKNNDVTNHIPIILLTALSGMEQLKEGMVSLADDYIVKPFNPELLQMRVDNLILIRKRIRDTFRKNSVYGNIKTDLPSPDALFMDKVFDFIKANMDNPDLRIDSFCDDLNLGRMQFYRKIKSITGKTPTALILEIRMNAAAELLKGGNFNVNEIAYQLGFNEASYFGKCFKGYFGCTPSEYKA